MKEKILIIVSQVNPDITSELEKDAIRLLKEYATISYDIVYVSGAFEIPGAIAFAISGDKNYSGYLALGCVLRGATSHYDIIAHEVARALINLTINYKVPIGYGVINAENIDQALERVGINSKKSYAQAAVISTIEMIEIKSKLM